MKFRLAEFCLAAATVVNAAKRDAPFLRGRGSPNLFDEVSICHYDARLRKFMKISVRRARLKNHIDVHGPAGGHKDTTVANANKIQGSKDCTCIFPYDGDGVNCKNKGPPGEPLAVCTSVSLTANGRCKAAVLASEIGKGSSDRFNQTLSYTLSPPGPYGPGDNNVTLTVTAGGDTSRCQANVKVVDKKKPSITCPDNISTKGTRTGGACTATAWWSTPLVSTDNCKLPANSVQRTIGNASGSLFEEGSTTVAYKVTDAAGNSNECSFVVAVYCEAPPPLPIAVCNNVTLKADANCQAAAVASEIGMGSSDPKNETLSYSLNPPGPFRPGNNPVELTVTAGGKRTSSCKANVKVVDEVKPSITCPSDITANVTGSFCSMLVSYPIPEGKDNCDVSANSTVLTAGKGSSGQFEVGKTVESFKVTDAAGLTAECKFTVTINHLDGVNSQCLELYRECDADSDCGSPSRYRCDKNNLCFLGDCDPKTDPCCQDSDCDADKRCISNVCVQKGKPSFALKWFGDDDLDLHVITPDDVEIYWKNDWDSTSGGYLENDVKNVTGKASRVENIYFPMVGAPTGKYTYWVVNHKPVGGPEDYKLAAYLDETMVRSDSGTLTKENNSSERFIYELI